MTEAPTLDEISLAVWDVPLAVAAGEPFAVKVGAKSSSASALHNRVVDVLDQSGARAASGPLGDVPWPGTAALYWAEVELQAPLVPGLATFIARFDAAELDPPFRSATSPFTVSVVGRPEHILTVTVAANGVPVEEAHIRLGALHALTDAAGRAEIKLAKGRYELSVYKAGFETEPVPLVIEADATVAIEARAQRADDPDAFWTA
jgi:hypothetical protein